MFLIWVIAIAGILIIGFGPSEDLKTWLLALFTLTFGGALFRLFLYGIYILARNRVTQQLSDVLNLKK